jgi:hypothetical protein
MVSRSSEPAHDLTRTQRSVTLLIPCESRFAVAIEIAAQVKWIQGSIDNVRLSERAEFDGLKNLAGNILFVNLLGWVWRIFPREQKKP